MLSAFLSEPASILIALAAFFLMIWPGYAVLCLLGLGTDRWPWARFAGPAVTLALWIIALSGSVWAGITLQRTAIPIYTATLVLAVIGLYFETRNRRKARAADQSNDPWLWMIMAATVAIPFLIMPASFRFGLADFANSNATDTWSYIAVADYLLTIPRGMEGGLSPLHQYAAHLMGVRNASPAFIGFLSIGLGGVKVSQAVVLFCLMVLFANATALVAFAGTAFRRVGAAATYLVIVGLGWPANIIVAGNFDQLLILPFLPAIGAFVLLVGAGREVIRASIIIGLLAAAAFYSYVELSILGLFVAGSLVAVPASPIRSLIYRAMVVCGIALPLALALTSPALESLLAMFESQYNIAGVAARPGEGYFPGLASPLYWLGSVWALGPEYLLYHVSLIGGRFGFDHVLRIGEDVGLALLLAMLIGLWAERKRWPAIVALTAICAAFGYFAFSQHYSYAAYKIISVNFWLVGLFAVSGIIWLFGFLPENVMIRRAMTLGSIIALLSIAILRLATANTITRFVENGTNQSAFREIETVARTIRNQPTVLSVRDPFGNEWAVFYLADAPMLLVPYRLYMAQAHVIPLMNRAKAVDPTTVRYIVTDRNDPFAGRVTGAHQIWEGKVYRLWAVDRPSWTVIADFEMPNGIESSAGDYWTWLSGTPATFTVVAGRAGLAELNGSYYRGPQAPQDPQGIRVTLIDTAGSHETTIRDIPNRLPIHLAAGKNIVSIKVDDATKALTSGPSDPRKLVLRMTNFTISDNSTAP